MNFTQINAGLKESATKLQIVPEQSVKLHFEHKDFPKIKKSEKINTIKEAQSTEELRKEKTAVLS